MEWGFLPIVNVFQANIYFNNVVYIVPYFKSTNFDIQQN